MPPVSNPITSASNAIDGLIAKTVQAGAALGRLASSAASAGQSVPPPASAGDARFAPVRSPAADRAARPGVFDRELSRLRGEAAAAQRAYVASVAANRRAAEARVMPRRPRDEDADGGRPPGPAAAGLREFSRVAHVATNALEGFAKAASPDAVLTLANSFALVQAQLGRSLVPYLASASRELQRFAGWIGSLPRADRDRMTGQVVTGVGVAAFAGAVGLATTSLQRLSGVLATPLGGLVAFGGALVALSAATHKLAADMGRDLRQMADAPKFAAAARQQNVMPEVERVRSIQDVNERRQVLELLARRAGERQTAADKDLSGATKQAAMNPLMVGYLDMFERLTGGEGVYARRERLSQAALAAHTRHMAFRQELEDLGRQQGGMPALQRQAKWPGSDLLTSWANASHGGAGYHGVDDLRDRVQLAVLQGDPLQAELKRLQHEQLQELQRHGGLLEKIADGPPRRP